MLLTGVKLWITANVKGTQTRCMYRHGCHELAQTESDRRISAWYDIGVIKKQRTSFTEEHDVLRITKLPTKQGNKPPQDMLQGKQSTPPTQ